ncbi:MULTISPECIES: hypothetical protein [unclassified Thioalkalivibrio]|uniref:hypothetical protein n=1 Tax=unclassified Thioalkalivibrio TaxID=2621013 RepID=UPI0003696237|nr:MULTISPECIES: hypothetical protein [unclassified Thioalkalivibrio]
MPNIPGEYSAVEAKKIVASVLSEHGLAYDRLRARTVSFEGLGYGRAVFVKPVGLRLPNPALKAAKKDLPKGVCLDTPQIVPPSGVIA